MTCAECEIELEVGAWPFCPHGDVGNFTNFKDDIPGGLVCENYGPQPITFYSHTERRAYMVAHGLREKETFCPKPGTDIDPAGIPSPEGYVDDITMRNRQELFLRAHNKGHAEPFDGVKAGVLRNLTSTDGHTHAEAIRAAKGE